MLATAAATAAPITTADKPQLSDATFKNFADLIYKLSGIKFQPNKAYFVASKLSARVQALKLPNFEAYYAHLQSATGKAEYDKFIDEITINETFFFRAEPQLQAFEKEVLIPLALKRRQQGRPVIRVWSCAASTGDELYTTALQTLLLDSVKDIKFEFVGTDICHGAIAQARSGTYRQYAIRNVPPAVLNKYFTHDPKDMTWTLTSEVKNRATFFEANLIDEAKIKSLGKFDIAFCRNVLIYFDDASKEKVLWNIYNVMNDDGTLLVGHSENIYSQRHIFAQDKSRTASLSYIKAPVGTPKL